MGLNRNHEWLGRSDPRSPSEIASIERAMQERADLQAETGEYYRLLLADLEASAEAALAGSGLDLGESKPLETPGGMEIIAGDGSFAYALEMPDTSTAHSRKYGWSERLTFADTRGEFPQVPTHEVFSRTGAAVFSPLRVAQGPDIERFFTDIRLSPVIVQTA